MFLYATDLLIGLLFLLWLFNHGRDIGAWFSQKRWRKTAGGLGIIIVPGAVLISWYLVASIFAPSFGVGAYGALKLAEFFWLFCYVLSLSAASLRTPVYALLAGGAAQSILAIAQFLVQHDMGLRILGENMLAPDLAGVAKIMVAGEHVIRAYGTFPHPNVLAAFLFICLFVVLVLLEQEGVTSRMRRAYLALIPLLLLALLLTFSRSILAFGLGSIAFWLFLGYRKSLLTTVKVLVSSLFIFGILLFPYFYARVGMNLNDQAVSFRLMYVKSTFAVIAEHPFVGVGPNHFTQFQAPRIASQGLPYYANQPVHNIYLLIIAETGLVGLFILYWFFRRYFAHFFKKPTWTAVTRCVTFPTAILFMASFDHFFLTFQQGGLIFWIALALAASSFILSS